MPTRKATPKNRWARWTPELVAAGGLAAVLTAAVYSLAFDRPVGVRPIGTGAAPSVEPPREESFSFPSHALSLAGVAYRNTEPMALIRVDDDSEQPFVLGDEVIAGIRIASVENDRVVLSYRGLTRTLYLQQRESVAAARQAVRAKQPLRVPVDDPFPKNPGIDPLSLNVTDIRSAREFLNEVKVMRQPDGGFLVQEVEPGSLYDQLGLRPGDVVHNMDIFAKYAGSPETRLMGIYAGDAELQVIRNGVVTILTTRPE